MQVNTKLVLEKKQGGGRLLQLDTFIMVDTVITYFSRASLIQIGKGSTEHIDWWMTCDFTSFSTVFQSYPDDV